LQALPNGVPLADGGSPRANEPVDVLFLARLHKRKRPEVFVEAADLLAREFPSVSFSLVGPDEGEEASIQELIHRVDPEGKQIRLEGALQPHETADRMRRSAIYVLPSESEPFPMSVLEAMSLGIPVVINHDCGLAPAVQGADAGIVVDGSAVSVANAISSLLQDEAERRRRGDNARELVRESFSMPSIAELLERIYRGAGIAGDRVESPA
jgi:glycosyltransferase involved in cell wall biosynthesis